MAEFAEIVKHASRLCKYYQKDKSCARCPLSQDAIEIERIVTDWAKEHPEPMYPSWHEAWLSLFPYAEELCPGKLFGEDCPEGMLCPECRERPMSKKVAEKLGIKPVGGGEDV